MMNLTSPIKFGALSRKVIGFAPIAFYVCFVE